MVVLVGMLTATLVSVTAPVYVCAEATEQKSFGEVDPDKTLLYIIRPKGARGGNSIAMDLFADTTFLLRVRGNSYGFVHVEPGLHKIWGAGDIEVIEFVPGETFYLVCGDQGMALLNEDEGKAHIDSVRYYNPPDPEVEANRSKKEEKAAKAMPKIEKLLANKFERAETPEIVTPPKPASVEGLLHVPMYTRVEVELMENVSSLLNQLGEPVWLRVREDAMVGDRVWLPAGTPVQGTIVEIKPARKGGVSGDIEIEISYVDAADGTRVPLIGQFIDTGRHRMEAAARAMAAGSLIGHAFSARGREAFELRGAPWHAWTRADVWVSPAEPLPPVKAESETDGPVAVTARFTDDLVFNLEKHQEVPEISLQAETDTELTAVSLIAVDDWSIPDPATAKTVSRSGRTSTATFDGWSLLRHLAAGSEAVPLRFAAETVDGRSLTATCEVTWEEASPE
jgi:hypothetical protein